MSQEQKWFEMPEIRKRTLDTAVWIPLRTCAETQTGQYGHEGYHSEFFGVGSLAMPTKARAEGEKLGWMDIGLIHDHFSYCERGRYVPADVYDNRRIKNAVRLVIAQLGNSAEPMTWHLHQDFVVALGLKREGDVCVAIDEGYIEVARLRTEERRRRLLEVRAENLKDYLCARRMALRIVSYRKREEVVEQAPGFDWPQPSGKPPSGDQWEGRVNEIHEGGSPYGSSMAVMHLMRNNLDFEEDVPTIDITDDVEVKTFTKNAEGRKLYRIAGELWRNEWVEPAKMSPRIKHDDPRPSVQFITTAAGRRETSKTLIGGGKWLWFQPAVIPSLFERRGGSLEWYTRDTGSVRCSPSDWVHFGVNSLGLVNAYAKDVAQLPEWQQKIWAGFNEGKVSEELFAAQAQGLPANTQAPEAYLSIGGCGTATAALCKALQLQPISSTSRLHDTLGKVPPLPRTGGIRSL